MTRSYWRSLLWSYFWLIRIRFLMSEVDMKHVLGFILGVSLFFNLVQYAVIVAYEYELSQYDYAIQFLGAENAKYVDGLCLERLPELEVER